MNSSIEIFKGKDNQTQIEVKFEGDTVWLSQAQMAELFDSSRVNVTEHINNVFKEGELEKNPTCRDFRQVRKEGNRNVSREIEHYNLDVIISVGYRVKSKRGTQFRIWANSILKEYLKKGYAVNEQKLKESQQQLKSLKQSIKLLENVVANKELSSGEAQGLLHIVTEYAQALDVLDQYDHQRLKISDQQDTDIIKLEYKEAIKQIENWREKHNAGSLFGNEKDKSLC
jgi:hypothetical protein